MRAQVFGGEGGGGADVVDVVAVERLHPFLLPRSVVSEAKISEHQNGNMLYE